MDKLLVITNGSKRAINAYFRANDTSHKWPICGSFNITERAIRRLYKLDFYKNGGPEYFNALDAEISLIVNKINH